jgi:GH25 family lysozyme M1 (1,4-beta-N-acetylmuramidase)
LLEEYEIDGPVAYDWEMHDSTYRVYGTTPEMATACAIAFCQKIEEAGYEAMIYAGQYVSYIKYDQGAIEPYLSWYPEYKSDQSEKLYPTFYYQVDYWQFSSNCTVDGIGGRVDANLHFIPR